MLHLCQPPIHISRKKMMCQIIHLQQYCNGRQYNEQIQVLNLCLGYVLVFLRSFPMESSNTKLHFHLYFIEYNEDMVSHLGYVYPPTFELSFAMSSSTAFSSRRINYFFIFILSKENSFCI